MPLRGTTSAVTIPNLRGTAEGGWPVQSGPKPCHVGLDAGSHRVDGPGPESPGQSSQLRSHTQDQASDTSIRRESGVGAGVLATGDS